MTRELSHRDPLPILDLLGRRWMPTIVHELGAGAIGFRELRRRCGAMSSSVLAQRLKELEEAELAAPDDFGSWELSPRGAVVAKHLAALAVDTVV